MKEKPRWQVNKGNYINQFQKEHYKNLGIRLNNETDSDIIEYLETVGNKAEYVKQLIRQDMAKK